MKAPPGIPTLSWRKGFACKILLLETIDLSHGSLSNTSVTDSINNGRIPFLVPILNRAIINVILYTPVLSLLRQVKMFSLKKVWKLFFRKEKNKSKTLMRRMQGEGIGGVLLGELMVARPGNMEAEYCAAWANNVVKDLCSFTTHKERSKSLVCCQVTNMWRQTF